jgi:hypothetical protein
VDRVARTVDLLEQSPQQLPVGGEHAVALVGELLVEGERGDARPLRHRRDRDLGVGLLRANLRHRRHQPFALVARDHIGRNPVRARRQPPSHTLSGPLLHRPRIERVPKNGRTSIDRSKRGG